MDEHASDDRAALLRGQAPRDQGMPATTQECNEKARQQIQPGLFRYQKRTLFIMCIYVPLLVIPWAVTCIMTQRPITQPAYINQAGQYSPQDVHTMRSATSIISALNSIAGILTVPVTSAMLAHAAVVYTQRRHAEQVLTATQTFALADRSWENSSRMLMMIWRAVWRYCHVVFGKTLPAVGPPIESSSFLWLASGLLVLSTLPQPLQQLMVSTKQITLVTCNDIPFQTPAGQPNNSTLCGSGPNGVVIGYDPEPEDMALMPLDVMMQTVADDILSVSVSDPQANVWIENSNAELVLHDVGPTTERFPTIEALLPSSESDELSTDFFVTALANGTNTGVLRQHAIRLNSSVTCNTIAANQVPTPCPGSRPFTFNYTLPGIRNISVCAPGAWDQSPWNLTRNRQDLNEDLYINVQERDYYESFAVRCSQTTSRGYFELGNLHNSFTPGPLLQTWPSASATTTDFNDYTSQLNGAVPPSANANLSNATALSTFTNAVRPLSVDAFQSPAHAVAPGPLMTTALALFGNSSFFEAIIQHNASASPLDTLKVICQQGSLPFGTISAGFGLADYLKPCNNSEAMTRNNSHMTSPQLQDDVEGIPVFFIRNFNISIWAETVLSVGALLANRAILVQTVGAEANEFNINGARLISTSPGTTLNIPVISVPAIAALSALIAAQVMALVALTVYVYWVPTWTGELNAAAIAQLACQQAPGAFGPFRNDYESDESEALLRSSLVDGVIGLEPSSGPSSTSAPVVLAFGGWGVISRSLAD